MTPTIIWRDGQLLAADNAQVSALSCAISHGAGAFTTALAYQQRIIAFEAHYQRLQTAAALIGLAPPPETSIIIRAVHALWPHQHGAYAKARIALLPDDSGSHCLITLQPCNAPCAVSPLRLLPIPGSAVDNGLLRGLKTSAWLPYRIAWQQARKQGYDDALLLRTDGSITEAATGNIHCLRENTLYTPPATTGALVGIGTQHLHHASKAIGLAVSEHALNIDELRPTDTLIFSNAVQLMRVVTLPQHLPVEASSWLPALRVQVLSSAGL